MRVVGYQPVVVAEAKIRFEPSISEEGWYSGGYRLYISTSEFGYIEQFVLIILIVINKRTEVLFYNLVGILTLAVCFRVIGGRQLSFNTKDLIKAFLYIGYKLRTPIRYD